MSTEDDSTPIEYPDRAGYPDGTGYLDEGQKVLVDEVTADALRAVDRPSADAEAQIEVHRLDDRHVYAATIGDLEVANIRFDEEDGRIVLITTTVVPEFRGRRHRDGPHRRRTRRPPRTRRAHHRASARWSPRS